MIERNEIDHFTNFVMTKDWVYCNEYELIEDPKKSHGYRDNSIKFDDTKLHQFFKKAGWIKTNERRHNIIIIPKGTKLYFRGINRMGYYSLFSIDKPNGIVMPILRNMFDLGDFADCVDYLENEEA